MELRVGIIGSGRHGSRYASHIINDLPELRLTAISRRSAAGEEQARQWGVNFYSDWRDLIAASEVDAVVAAVPPNLNLDIGSLCSLNNKPLLLEKPLSLDGARARGIVEICRDIPLTVGHTLRFNPVIKGLKDHLAAAGPLHCFHANQHQEKPQQSWQDDPEVAGGGVILHTAIHMFDSLRYITGLEVRRVKATSLCRHSRVLEDLFVGVVEMENGVIGTVEASTIGPGRSGRYEFVGEQGVVQGDQVHGRLERVMGMEITPLQTDDPGPALIPLLHQWADFIGGRGENPVTPEDGLAAVAMAEACISSSIEEGWVEVG